MPPSPPSPAVGTGVGVTPPRLRASGARRGGGAGAALPAAGASMGHEGGTAGPAGPLPSGTGRGKKRGRERAGEDFVSPFGMAVCAAQAGGASRYGAA